VIQVSGELNSDTCRRLVSAIDQVYERRGRHVTVDIARVESIDDAGRRCLLECEHRAHLLNISFELQPRTAVAAMSAS
jgi:ABC-type transporter Mla MlaB component